MRGRAWLLMVALWVTVPGLGAAVFADETSETSPTDRKPESKFFDAGDGVAGRERLPRHGLRLRARSRR